jgi:hypothetical protein
VPKITPQFDFSHLDKELGSIECDPVFQEAIEKSFKVDLEDINARHKDFLERKNPTTSSQQIDSYIGLLSAEASKPDPTVAELMSCRTYSSKISIHDCVGTYDKSSSELQGSDPSFAQLWNFSKVEALDCNSLEANEGSDLIIKYADNIIMDTNRLNVVVTDMMLNYFFRSDFVIDPSASFRDIGK